MEKNRIRPVKAGKGLRMSYSRQKEVFHSRVDWEAGPGPL